MTQEHQTPALGISGRIASFFQSAQITPLLALVALLLGIFAVLVTPREEEPQINVTMANVLIPFPGASVRDVEQMVAIPAEQVLSQISGSEHVMSVSQPGMAVITVQFKVGVPRTEALVRLHDTVTSHADWLPQNLGVQTPLVKPKGIDDVPIVTLTLFARQGESAAFDLERVAHSMEAELKRDEWFGGSEFSAADVIMSFPLEAAAQRAGLDASRPRLAGFLQRIHARPAYRRALERGGPYSFAD